MPRSSRSADVAKAAMRSTVVLLHESHRVGFLVGADPPEGSFRIDELISIAVVQTNIASLMRDPGQSHTYSTFEATPPDSLRRPASIRGISASLRLPYETTRRRIAGLVSRGLMISTDEGLYVPQSVLASPLYLDGCLVMADKLRELYVNLRLIDALPPLSPDAPEPADPMPYRAFMRRFGEYFLRLMDGMTRIVGELTPVIVLMGLMHEAVTEGRPVSVLQLAQRVRLPYETTRRNLAVLETADLCRRTRAGVEAPSAMFDRPEWAALCESNLADLRRFYAELEGLGVLAHWAEPAAAS